MTEYICTQLCMSEVQEHNMHMSVYIPQTL